MLDRGQPFCNMSPDLERRIVLFLKKRGLAGSSEEFDRLLEIELRLMPDAFERLRRAGYFRVHAGVELYEIGEWGMSFWYCCTGDESSDGIAFDNIVSVPMENIVSVSTFFEDPVPRPITRGSR